MDRNNWLDKLKDKDGNVATREGGVDRNKLTPMDIKLTDVATREGGVDRNSDRRRRLLPPLQSPPARVAWIETCWRTSGMRQWLASPPARVAWIETFSECGWPTGFTVATREGGVDRNRECLRELGIAACRHPRGWRG